MSRAVVVGQPGKYRVERCGLVGSGSVDLPPVPTLIRPASVGGPDRHRECRPGPHHRPDETRCGCHEPSHADPSADAAERVRGWLLQALRRGPGLGVLQMRLLIPGQSTTELPQRAGGPDRMHPGRDLTTPDYDRSDR